MTWTADKRYCLTADGRVVADDDPEARTVLIGEGSQMSLADAERYGLVKPEPEATEKQVAGPPANKARDSAPNTK
jgi:hypothetical protein